MKKLLYVPLLSIGVVVDVLIGAWLVASLSAFLHSNWWDAIPAFEFSHAALLGVVIYSFNSMTSLSFPIHTWSSVVMRVILGLGIAPLILPWIVGELNNTFTAIPDISYGTCLLLGLIGLGIAVVNALVSIAFSFAGDYLKE